MTLGRNVYTVVLHVRYYTGAIIAPVLFINPFTSQVKFILQRKKNAQKMKHYKKQ